MKLIYFASRGRVEPARLMLELTGTPYEFEGITVETWRSPDGKDRWLQSTPYGQLPVMHDGSFALCQSQAINRYLARKLGLYGETIEEMARVDEVSETANDIILDLAAFHWDTKFAERRAAHRESTAKKLGLVDKYFARVGAGPEHWVLPGRYTMADVLMAYAFETTLPMHPGLLEQFPRLHHAMNAFFAADGVREYVRSDRRARTWTVHLATFAGKPEETHQWTD